MSYTQKKHNVHPIKQRAIVDAHNSKSSGSNTLRVRVSLRPPSYGDK